MSNKIKYQPIKMATKKSMGLRKRPITQKEVDRIMKECKENSIRVEKWFDKTRPTHENMSVIFNSKIPSY